MRGLNYLRKGANWGASFDDTPEQSQTWIREGRARWEYIRMNFDLGTPNSLKVC